MSLIKKKYASLGFAVLMVVMGLVVLASCTQESYEDGDGDYSYLRADFAEIKTNQKGEIASFVTDDNKEVTLKKLIAVEGLKADTTYRSLVYYKEPRNADVELFNLKMVNVCTPFKPTKDKPLVTDPTGWESMWVSHNGSYLNLALKLLVGVDTENAEAKQVLGVCQDSIVGRHIYYTLYHKQNGVPEYYTYTSYLSLSLAKDYEAGDTITMAVNTYDGIKRKTVVLP